MKIESKFNIGDSAWFVTLFKDKIRFIEGRVNTIDIHISDREYIIKYKVESTDIVDGSSYAPIVESIEGDKLFKTVEDLSENLIENKLNLKEPKDEART